MVMSQVVSHYHLLWITLLGTSSGNTMGAPKGVSPRAILNTSLHTSNAKASETIDPKLLKSIAG
jgi:hypothetical protein